VHDATAPYGTALGPSTQVVFRKPGAGPTVTPGPLVHVLGSTRRVEPSGKDVAVLAADDQRDRRAVARLGNADFIVADLGERLVLMAVDLLPAVACTG
jgi:hypothetical protein